MAQSSASETQSRSNVASAGEQTGCYVYCIAPGSEELSLGAIGIDGDPVYTIMHNNLGALVHRCPPQPYQSDDSDVVAAWVLAHHRVVEAAWQRWGTVLPLTFNTIIAAGERSAEENVVAWLEAECESLRSRLDAFTGKMEYGVQVFWDPTMVARKIAEASPEIAALEKEIQSKGRGVAYMYRQKLEAMLRKKLEVKVEEESRGLYTAIRRCVAGVHVEKTKAAQEGRQMIMNLSCLVSSENYRDLKGELEKVGSREGFFVRVAGPFPPYSFC
jgi:hypothetical protein